MYEQNEREIDLKWLLYRALTAWRKAIVWGIIIALVLGFGSLAMTLVSMTDEEFMEEEKLAFEYEHAAWVAAERNFELQLENLEIARARKIEYNEKSIMMKIDPLRKNIASFQLYVFYDYELNWDSTIQNIDFSNRILASYATYMTNGELYHYIINNLNYDIELRYLSEIFSVSVDYDSKMISASVVHADAQACQDILNLAQAAILSRQDDINERIAEHEITLNNQAAYETIDLGLQDAQKENTEYITRIDLSIQEVMDERREWRKEKEGIEPVWKYSVIELIKSTIKMMIIGGIVGVILVLIIAAVVAMMAGKLVNPEDMKNRFGVRLIGSLPTERKKLSFAKIDRWVVKKGGITAKPEDYVGLARMIGASIKSDIESREDAAEWKTVAFTGTASVEDVQKTVAAFNMDNTYNVICAPDVLTNAESIDAVAGADCVVLIETKEKSVNAEIAKELEALKAWNKPVLGAVVINADAVM